MIEREIIADQFLVAACEQRFSALLDVNRPIADRADKTRIKCLPMKDLAGLERFLQIEIDRANLFRHSTIVIRHSS